MLDEYRTIEVSYVHLELFFKMFINFVILYFSNEELEGLIQHSIDIKSSWTKDPTGSR